VGWSAEREQPGAPWRRAPSSGEDEQQPESDDDLSPEADKFLAEACDEYEEKQRAFEKQWRFDSIREWGFDQDNGILSLSLEDGSYVEASAQIIGSYSSKDDTWEWAWNNPCADDRMAEHSRMIKELGKCLGLDYLQESPIDVPAEAVEKGHLGYFCAIALKATGAAGVFDGPYNESLRIFYTLNDLRWANPSA